MDRNDFDTYRADETPLADPEIHVSDIDGPDRTLVYGTAVNSHGRLDTFHAYKADGELHVVIFKNLYEDGIVVMSYTHGASLPAKDMSPSKRAFPERTDLEFARLMRSRGTALCFTNFDDSPGIGERYDAPFFGPRIGHVTVIDEAWFVSDRDASVYPYGARNALLMFPDDRGPFVSEDKAREVAARYAERLAEFGHEGSYF